MTALLSFVPALVTVTFVVFAFCLPQAATVSASHRKDQS